MSKGEVMSNNKKENNMSSTVTINGIDYIPASEAGPRPEANGINNSFNSAVVRNGTVVYEDTFWLTPTQARNDAADLVAAANAAEAAR